MTFVMSTEEDSVKSGLSETNDKTVTDNHSTDESSQDSVESKETPVPKPIENNVASPIDDKPKEESTEGESDHESKPNDDADTSAEPEMEKPEEEVSEKVEKTEEKSENGKEEREPKKEDEAKLNDKESKKEKASSEKEDEEEEEEEEVAEGEEEEKPEKKGIPLLDQPLETTGKRERKNVQRFEEDIKKSETTVVEFEEGKGTALGEIPRVEASITRFKNDDLKYLHKLLFNAVTNKVHFKKNIRKFNGFPFNKDSDDYTKKVESLKKNEVKILKTICEILDLSKTGTKEELVEKIMDFLVEPKDSGKPVGGTGRPKRASAVRANNRGYSSHDDYSSDERHASRAKRDKGKRANLKDESSSDEDFKPGDVSEGSDDKPRKRKRGRPRKGGSSDEDEASLTEGSSDESDDAPKTKRRKSITKSNSKSKSKRRGRPTKAAAASAPRTKGRRGRKAKDMSSEEEEEEEEEERMDEGSSSEDEPLAKKKAKVNEPPSDDDIKAFIKDVLDGANLEEITMKTVCQRVYDNYPDFDLTARKSFIKSTVKSLIST